jgi:stage III sporulation protein SpoIIIAA
LTGCPCTVVVDVSTVRDFLSMRVYFRFSKGVVGVAVVVGVDVFEKSEERISAPQGARSRAVTEVARISKDEMNRSSNMVDWTNLTRVYRVESW